MSQSEIRSFSCPACGRRFAWKPALEGRKVGCKCGERFTVATALPEDPFDQPPAETVPGAEQAAASPAAPSTRAALPDDIMLKYGLAGARTRPAAAEEEESEEGTVVTNLYLPLALIGVGLLLWGVTAGTTAAADQSLARLAAMAVLSMIVFMAVMLGGCFVATMLMDVSFGPLGTAALKLFAVALLAMAVSAFILSLDPDPDSIHGLIVAVHAVPLIYFVCFAMLFTLDLQENLMTVAIIGALQLMAFCALWGHPGGS